MKADRKGASPTRDRLHEAVFGIPVAIALFSAPQAAAWAAEHPAAGRGPASVVLSEAHLATVNRTRRIYVNNDVGYDAVIGPKASPITHDAWISAPFSAFDQPGTRDGRSGPRGWPTLRHGLDVVMSFAPAIRRGPFTVISASAVLGPSFTTGHPTREFPVFWPKPPTR